MNYSVELTIAILTILAIIITMAIYTWSISKIGEKMNSNQEISKNISNIGSIRELEITVLVDNNPNPPLKDAWGLSIYIKVGNISFLFDAGPDPDVLRRNSAKLNINLKNLNFIVISHEHRDHIEGLKYVAEISRNLKVYIPKHSERSLERWMETLGFKPVRIGETTIIEKGIAIIGELYGPPYEEALAINVENKGLIIIVGCSHPGVDKIVKKAVKELKEKPYLVIGGFHLAGAGINEIERIIENLNEMGIKKIYPIHCSGESIRKYLENNYPKKYGDGRVGLRIKLCSQ